MADTPTIRFKGFTDVWEQRKLGELVEIGDIDHRMPSTVSEGIPYLMTGDFCGINELNFNDVKMISEQDYELLSRKIRPEQGDILFARYASVGAVRYIDFTRKFLISYSCAILKKSEKINAKYLYHFLTCNEAKRQIQLAINTGSQANIGIDSMKNNIFISMPNVEEQNKIAQYFDNLDHLIILHQRKCDETIELKKYMLQKMFPQNSKKIPEIRFAGFTDDWEQRKAADIADYSKGNGYSKSDLVEVGTPIILYGRLYTNYQFVIDEVDTFAVPKSGAVYSQGNEVIVPASGETAEDIARAAAVEKSGILLGGDLNILRPFDFINPLFLALAISNGEPQKKLAKRAQGKSVVHIRNSDIQEVAVSYPTRTEQDKIIAVFRNLDYLITLHQRKCDELKEVKKFMLQNMFPQKG